MLHLVYRASEHDYAMQCQVHFPFLAIESKSQEGREENITLPPTKPSLAGAGVVCRCMLEEGGCGVPLFFMLVFVVGISCRLLAFLSRLLLVSVSLLSPCLLLLQRPVLPRVYGARSWYWTSCSALVLSSATFLNFFFVAFVASICTPSCVGVATN